MANSENSVVIVSAARTPVGSFNGALSSLSAHALGAVALKAAMERAKVEAKEVDESHPRPDPAAGAGQNPARQASMAPACAAGSDRLGPQPAVRLGPAHHGARPAADRHRRCQDHRRRRQESMSMAPHCQHLRNGVKMGDFKMIDTMIKDGLTDAFYGYHMGNTAENVARQWQLTRDDQDHFAVASQNKAEAAQKAGRFKDEIVPVTIKPRARRRHRRRPGRIYPPWRDARFACQAARRLRQGRHRHRRQCLRHQ
jgi:acetyl-CoA C-acetyltransferase